MTVDALVPAELAEVRANATCLADMATVDGAVAHMADAMTTRLAGTNPLLLGVMTGAVVTLGLLLPRLDFPLQVDYVHLTRYGTETVGGTLSWIKAPPDAVKDRVVVLVDDILDHGLTLAELADACRARGAREVLTAVLVTKDLPQRAGLAAADFSALTLPDLYLFGCGMDYKTWLRNAPGIFAVTA